MTMLTVQAVLWCLIGFAVGALGAWLLAVVLYPHRSETEPLAEHDGVAR